MEVRLFTDGVALGKGAAGELAALAAEAVARRGRFFLVLTGGRTVQPLYEALAEEYAASVPWGSVHLFWGDERCVPDDDPASNYRMARELLVSRVGIPDEQVYAMSPAGQEPGVAAQRYEATLRRAGIRGTGPMQEEMRKAGSAEAGSGTLFDVVLLSLGEDGHVASLFPESGALGEQERLVVPVVGPKPPPQRLTLTIPALNASRAVWVLAAGPGKAEALRRARHVNTPPGAAPSRLLAPATGELVWWVDRAAAEGEEGVLP